MVLKDWGGLSKRAAAAGWRYGSKQRAVVWSPTGRDGIRDQEQGLGWRCVAGQASKAHSGSGGRPVPAVGAEHLSETTAFP